MIRYDLFIIEFVNHSSILRFQIKKLKEIEESMTEIYYSKFLF